MTDDSYEICEACNERAFDGTVCKDCGSVSLDWLHEQLNAEKQSDGSWSVPGSELRNAGGWL